MAAANPARRVWEAKTATDAVPDLFELTESGSEVALKCLEVKSLANLAFHPRIAGKIW